MSKIMRTTFKGMSLAAKASLISLFTILLTFALYQGVQMTSHAAPLAATGTWLLAYGNGSYPASTAVGNTTIASGSNRLLVVTVATTSSALTAVTITNGSGAAGTTPTIGGQSLTYLNGDATSVTTWNHTAVYYMKEAQIAAMTGTALGITITGGTSRWNWVHYRVYTGVDQTTPITDSQNYNSAAGNTTVGPFATNLNIGVDDQAIEILSLGNSTTAAGNGTIVRNIGTWATGWSVAAGNDTQTNGTTTSPSNHIYLADHTVNATTVTTDASYHNGVGGSAYDSMTAISIKPLVVAALTVNGNTPVASGSKLDTDAGILMQRVAVTGSAPMELNSVTIDDLGTTNNLANIDIYISPTSATVLPADAVLIATQANWAGTSTTFALTTGTTANRSLAGTEPLTKYIYVVYDFSTGQASKTAQSSITAVGVVSPAVSATGLALSSNIITLAYSGNNLSATVNVTGASTAKDSDAAVVMQHFTVNCNAAFDSALELNSLTLQDSGSATLVSTVKIYVATGEGATPSTLPSSAIQIGQLDNWNKASTIIPLVNVYGATATDRTILAGTPKYIYVVYGMYYPDDLAVVWPTGTLPADKKAGSLTAATVQSQVTAVGVASPDISIAALSYQSSSIQLIRGTWAKITSCGGCHATTSMSDAALRDASLGQFPGTHSTHTNTYSIDCSTCHIKPTVYKHANGIINFAGDLAGGKYSRALGDSVKVSNTNTTFGTCVNIVCHGSQSPVWGVNTTDSSCVKCHGVKGTTPTQYTTDPNTAAPGYKGTGTALDGATTASNNVHVGAHDAHLNGLINKISSPIACAECHSVPAAVMDAGHIDTLGPAEVPMSGTLATSNGAAPLYDSANATCTNVYCHFAKPHNAAYAPAVGNASVVWNTVYLNGTVADCQKCHLSPPTTASGVHVGKAFPSSCNDCHKHVSTAGAITDPTKHINGAVDASGGHSFPYQGATHMVSTDAGVSPWPSCNGCHNTTATGVTYVTWAANSRGTAPNCTTCHLNGLNVPVATSSCYDCHGATATDGMPNGASFPNLAGSHTKHVVGQGLACTTCHNGGGTGTVNHGNSNGVTRTTADITVASATGQFTFAWAGGSGKGTCSSVACHGTAEWGVTTFDCVSCHSSLITITKGPLANGTNQRRAVASELTTSGSRNHKGTAAGTAPTKWDCIVCHLEGDNATGSQAAAYHGNGVLDFRDPDGTGNQPIKKVSWGGLPYAAGITDPGGRYKDTMTNFTTARFSRDLNLTLESDPAWLKVATIQMNLCLHCHDSNGATNTTSWTKNSAGAVVGSAYKPFGLAVGNSSAQYWVTTTLKTAAGNTTGNVMNVFSQLSSANASSHPVTGRGNNGFAKGTQMKAPWNDANNAPRRSTTVYGYLISCFDCHGVKSSTGAQSATVVAHGNGTTGNIVALRSPYPTAALGGIAISGGATNLCTLCHADTYVSTTNGHGPNSGITAGPQAMSATTFGTCANCHVTMTDSVSARAVAVHGYNATESGSATFPTTASRPYAFWRGGPQVTYWGPGSCSVSCTTQTYTTAGAY